MNSHSEPAVIIPCKVLADKSLWEDHKMLAQGRILKAVEVWKQVRTETSIVEDAKGPGHQAALQGGITLGHTLWFSIWSIPSFASSDTLSSHAPSLTRYNNNDS